MDTSDVANGLCFPYDVVLQILRRLPQRAIARSRCVCRMWRAIVNTHKLFNSHKLILPLPHYFPRRAFRGIFFSKHGFRSRTSFFAPPGSWRLSYPHDATVHQSCNGLLLIADLDDKYVLNPATARCSRLPSLTPWQPVSNMSLAFDPAVSLHYDVFLLQKKKLAGPKQGEEPLLKKPQEEAVEVHKERVVPCLVYSSRTGQWENREFVPGQCAPEHLYDAVAMPSTYDPTLWSSDYWRGSIYMHCHKNILMVLSPSYGTYDMVQLPGEPGSPKSSYTLPWKSVLASYERGIHYVAIKDLQLRVWMLNESTVDQLGWTLAYNVSLNLHGHMIKPRTVRPMVTWRIVGTKGRPANLTEDDDYDDGDSDEHEDEDEDDDDDVDDDNDDYDDEKGDGDGYSWNSDNEEDGEGYGSSWDSDKDNFIEVGGGTLLLGPPKWGTYCRIVGFHPHKNALILIIHFAVVVYHLETSRMQYLGDEDELMRNPVQQACCVNGSFTYRPCYEDVL